MHRIAKTCGPIFLVYLLSACVPAHHPETRKALAGTSWELLSIQSMDDATGTTHIPEPARYALTFGSDGRASFRLNCNRANGDWRAQPGRGGDSGQLAFGPLAATKALCPPPSEDEHVVLLPAARKRVGLAHKAGGQWPSVLVDKEGAGEAP